MTQTADYVAPAMVEVTLRCGCTVTAPNHSDQPVTCANKACPDMAPDSFRASIKPRTRY
jgi:hypothetical protein